MDRHFAATFEADLTPNWVLSDSFGRKFNVTYNMDTANPKIIHGWTDLEKSYVSQIWDAHVQCRYIGNSKFEITIFWVNVHQKTCVHSYVVQIGSLKVLFSLLH